MLTFSRYHLALGRVSQGFLASCSASELGGSQRFDGIGALAGAEAGDARCRYRTEPWEVALRQRRHISKTIWRKKKTHRNGTPSTDHPKVFSIRAYPRDRSTPHQQARSRAMASGWYGVGGHTPAHPFSRPRTNSVSGQFEWRLGRAAIGSEPQNNSSWTRRGGSLAGGGRARSLMASRRLRVRHGFLLRTHG